jgi:hypothetical protein
MAWPEKEARRMKLIAAKAEPLWSELKRSLDSDAREYNEHLGYSQATNVSTQVSDDGESVWVKIEQSDTNLPRQAPAVRKINVVWDRQTTVRANNSTSRVFRIGSDGDDVFFWDASHSRLSVAEVSEAILRPSLLSETP